MGGISKEELQKMVEEQNKNKPSIGNALAKGMEKIIIGLGLACDPKKTMSTPAIDKAVRERQLQEKRIHIKEKQNHFKTWHRVETINFEEEN